jgi:serine protease Do
VPDYKAISKTPPEGRSDNAIHAQSGARTEAYSDMARAHGAEHPVSPVFGGSNGGSYAPRPDQRLDYRPDRIYANSEDARLSEFHGDSAVSSMYTPGIYAGSPHQHQHRRRNAENQLDGDERRQSGGLMRAVCLILVCALISGAAAFMVIEYRIRKGDFIPTVNQVVLGSSNENAPKDVDLTNSLAVTGAEMSAQDIYDMACSQVVGITTEIENASSFFGQQGTTTAVSGSGFIISSDGYILTNYHVVETAYHGDLPLKVYLNDESSYNAKIVGYESSNDIALIKIEATDLNAAVIGNSDNIRVGQRVYAVGNPFGELVYTMTDGIVSALDRVVTVENKKINTLQFSAAVNPGNSGGPVYDTNGEVIGIVSAKYLSNNIEGIGFAIPINDAIDIASELIEHGYLKGRAYLGIMAKTVTRGQAEYFEWGIEGAFVTSVTQDSAASKAGMMIGDIIIKINDDDIDSRDTLVYILRKYRAGDTATLTVRRAGEDVEMTVVFDENMTAGQPQ